MTRPPSASRSTNTTRNKTVIVVGAVILPILLIGLLIFVSRRWSQTPGEPTHTASIPTATPTRDALPTPTPGALPTLTAVAPPLATDQPIVTPAGDAGVSLAGEDVARINGVPVAASVLVTMQVADAVVARLLGQPAPNERDSLLDGERPLLDGERPLLDGERPLLDGERPLLDRLINGEIVAQAARAASFTLSDAEVDSNLQTWLTRLGKSQDELDRALSADGLSAPAFRAYFAHLLTVDRFAAQAAERANMTVPDYVHTLQQSAQVSLGPAAMEFVSQPAVLSSLPTASEDTPPAANPPDAAQMTPTVTAPQQPAALSFALATVAGVEGAMTAVTATTQAAPSEERGLETGNLAPIFDLPLLGDDPAARLTLADLAGKPTVLSFWTTWCPYCLQQTPVLVAAHANPATRDIQWVGVNVQEDGNTVGRYVSDHQIEYPIVLDAAGEVADLYAVNGYPITYFLDAQTRVVARHLGALTGQTLAEYLRQLDQIGEQ